MQSLLILNSFQPSFTTTHLGSLSPQLYHGVVLGFFSKLLSNSTNSVYDVDVISDNLVQRILSREGER